MEWLLLALLIPAVVIPVVLFFGFAGCDLVFPLNPPNKPPPPINLSAVARRTSITLTWEDGGPAGADTTYRVERTPDHDPPGLKTTAATTFADIGVTEATTYTYRVMTVRGDVESDFSSPLAVATTTFEPAFSETLTLDGTAFAGDCAIQRIEPARLFKSGAEVRITVASAATGPLQIDRIFISRPDPQGDNVYDAATDLMQVAVNVSVSANTTMTLAPVSYALDQTQPLLIAFDFNAVVGSANVRRRANVPPAEATLFRRNNTAQADLADRAPDYLDTAQIIVVTLIEVA